MTYFPVQPRYSVYVDSLGDPLDDGYIYLGKANLDPTVYPAKASWDEAGLYPITFPVRTMNGYPLRDGIPAQMYLNFSDNTEYSVLINDEDGVEVFSSTTGLIGYFPSGDGGDAATLNGLASSTAATADTIAARDNSGDITANAFESTVATGTAPLTVASTTKVANLNADLLDNYTSSVSNADNTVAVRGSTGNLSSESMAVGFGSGGDSILNFYDLTNATYRSLFWDDSASDWAVEDGTGTNQTLYHSGTSSASDTFTTSDAKTVTVVNGLITSIV